MEIKYLIRTDTIGYKIKKFFRNLFRKKQPEEKPNYIISVAIKRSNVFEQDLALIKQAEIENRKRNTARQLMQKEINIQDLNDAEVIEMIAYFKEYVQKLNLQVASKQ